MLRKISILIASSAVSLVTISAVAQPAPQPTHQPREPMTREAVATHAAAMFTRLDVNADGQLNAADREARADQRGEARFERIDSNGDGAISRSEFDSHHDQMQQRRQARTGENAGEGTRDAGREGRRARDMARGAGPRGPMGGRMMGGPGALANADADSNGAVSQAEFTSAMLARFDAADADHNGTVTREERRAMRPEGRGQRGR